VQLTNIHTQSPGDSWGIRRQPVSWVLVLIFSCLPAAIPAKVEAKEKGNPACDAAGRWELKVTRQGNSRQCGPAPSTADDVIIVAQKGKGYEVREPEPTMDDVTLRVETSSLGGCRLIYHFSLVVSFSSPPDVAEFDYELLEKDGAVAGILLRREAQFDPDEPKPTPACAELRVVTGIKKPLSASDVAIDYTKIPSQFISFYKIIMKGECTLPIMTQKKTMIRAVRTLVGTDGVIRQLWVDGADQHLSDNCGKSVGNGGMVSAFKNPTGTDQTLEFTVPLP
jgi:hypothetical protein